MTRQYRRAIASMQPSRAEMQRRHAPYLARMESARASVKAEILAGADPATLYRDECAKGEARDNDKCTILIGVLRRGMAALD